MTLDDRLKRAVDSLGEKLRDEITKELSSLSLAAPRDEAGLSRLADAMRAIDYAKSLSDILETLATAASNESARAGVFLVTGSALRSFRLFGFPAQFEDAPVELPLSRAGVLADAIRQCTVATADASPFDDLPPGVNATAIPLVLAGAPVGALYVEGADVAAVEILARFASRALEAQTAMKAARAVAEGGVA
jgi:hypothetical protein